MFTYNRTNNWYTVDADAGHIALVVHNNIWCVRLPPPKNAEFKPNFVSGGNCGFRNKNATRENK